MIFVLIAFGEVANPNASRLAGLDAFYDDYIIIAAAKHCGNKGNIQGLNGELEEGELGT
jgi:hypothetical protein